MLFEDVGRGVWSSVVYCSCITSGLIPNGWGNPPCSPNKLITLPVCNMRVCVCACTCVCVHVHVRVCVCV